LQTFQENKPFCELTELTQPQKPFFAFYGNKTYYSLPHPIVVRITCQEALNTPTSETETRTLEGMGQIEIQPSCTIILPDNRKYFSNPILEAENLGQTNMLNLLKESQPNTFNYTFNIPIPTPAPTMPPFVLRKTVNNTLLQQIISEISEPAKSLTTLAIFGTLMLIILILFLCCCMFNPCFRTWFTTCTFMKNPRTWWTQYKRYDLTDFKKLAPSTLPLSRFKQLFSSQPPSPRMQEMQRNLAKSVDDIENEYHDTRKESTINLTSAPQLSPSYIAAQENLYPHVIFATPTPYANPSFQTTHV